MKNIKIFEFINGEKVLAEINSVANDVYGVKKAFIVIPQMDQTTGKVGLQFGPWPAFADHSKKDVEYIVNDHSLVVSPYEPVKEIIDAYNTRTSGLVMTQGSKLITP